MRVRVKDVAIELAEKTNGELVQVIGYKFVIYRKNKENQKIILPRGKKNT